MKEKIEELNKLFKKSFNEYYKPDESFYDIFEVRESNSTFEIVNNRTFNHQHEVSISKFDEILLLKKKYSIPQGEYESPYVSNYYGLEGIVNTLSHIHEKQHGLKAHEIFNNAFMKYDKHSPDSRYYIATPGICCHHNSFDKKLSLESLKEAISLIEAKGLKARMLLVPSELQHQVVSLYYQGKDARTICPTHRVSPYLISPTAWFILTDAPYGLIHWIREEDTLEIFHDTREEFFKAYGKWPFEHYKDTIAFRILGRHSYGYGNFDCVFGSTGTD